MRCINHLCFYNNSSHLLSYASDSPILLHQHLHNLNAVPQVAVKVSLKRLQEVGFGFMGSIG